jgi:hypothetical protein
MLVGGPGQDTVWVASDGRNDVVSAAAGSIASTVPHILTQSTRCSPTASTTSIPAA